MKRVPFLIVLILSVVVTSAQNADFRGASWGSSLSNVKSAEHARFVLRVKDYELVYTDLLGGEEANVYYIFNTNDKLLGGMYRFKKEYANAQLYVEDYNKFKDLLVKKYGKPASETQIKNSNMSDTENQNFGQLVADGNLSLSTIWNTGRTIVKIALVTGTNKRPTLQIQYTTKSFVALENQEELKATIGKL